MTDAIMNITQIKKVKEEKILMSPGAVQCDFLFLVFLKEHQINVYLDIY